MKGLFCRLGFHYWGPLFLNKCNLCGKKTS